MSTHDLVYKRMSVKDTKSHLENIEIFGEYICWALDRCSLV